jgi:hypothetical protein
MKGKGEDLHLSGPTQSSLDLITNQQDVVFLADLGNLGKVSIVGNKDSADQLMCSPLKS